MDTLSTIEQLRQTKKVVGEKEEIISTLQQKLNQAGRFKIGLFNLEGKVSKLLEKMDFAAEEYHKNE